jgi:hypothetical protein
MTSMGPGIGQEMRGCERLAFHQQRSSLVCLGGNEACVDGCDIWITWFQKKRGELVLLGGPKRHVGAFHKAPEPPVGYARAESPTP